MTTIFLHTGPIHTVTLLTWGKLTENENFKDFNTVRDILGENLTQEKFQNLKIGWNRAKKKFCVDGKKGSTLNS